MGLEYQQRRAEGTLVVDQVNPILGIVVVDLWRSPLILSQCIDNACIDPVDIFIPAIPP
jgi:hypothetical protein